MKYLRVVGFVAVAVLAVAGIGMAAASATQLGSHKVTVQINGLPHRCSVTAWESFTLPPNGHQPWRFTMHYGAGTSCAGGRGLKFLTVEVDRKVGSGHWQIVDKPVTNRIVRPTYQNPLRVSTSWTALPSTPMGTATTPVKYRVLAAATVSFAKHPSIPPEVAKGVTQGASVTTPAVSP
jgi:hypothetical protein